MCHIWVIYGPYVSHIWAIYRPYMGHISAIYRPYVAHIWAIYGPYMGHTWAIYGPCIGDIQEPPKHLVQSASFFVPQTCILSSITAKNQSHRSKVQSFTISGSPATRVPASQQWIVQWVEIFSSRCARSVNFFVIAFLFVKSLVKKFRAARAHSPL